MAINDSEILRSSTLDLTSLRTKNARIERLYDSRNITPRDTKRLNADLKKYIEYLADNFDSEDTLRQFDSDQYGIPSNWDRNNNLYAGVDDGTGWAPLRARLDGNDNSFTDGGGNTYPGAPQIILTADSENKLIYHSFTTLLKAHFVDYLKNDRTEKNRIERELQYLSADSDQFPKLSKKITTAYEDDPAGLTDLLQLMTSFLRTNTNVNPEFSFNQTAPLEFDLTPPFTADSDPDGFLRGQRWYIRRKLGQVVVDALQFDSEFGGGNNRRYGKNELLNRLNLSLGLHNRRNFSSQLLLLGANFFNAFDFQWTARDSDGVGNLTDSDSRGYSLGINNDIARVAGDRFAVADFLDDSETILSYIKRIELFGNFWSRRLGAVDSETVQKIHDSEYMNKRSPAGRLTNYYNYHPSFKARLHRENERFIDRILIRGYLTNKDDSDSQIKHRRRLLNPLLQTFEVSDSETNRLWNSLINFADSDSDIVSRLGNTILDRIVPDSDNEDVLSVDSDLRQRWGRFVSDFIGDIFLDSEAAANMIEEQSIDSEKALILINANSVDSEETIKLIQQYSPDSDEVIKLVNQYSTDSDEVIKLVNQYAVDSEEAIKLVNQHAVDSDEALILIAANTFDSEAILNMVEENSIDSDDALILILANSVDSENVVNMIEEQSIDSEVALALINANSVDSEEAIKLINANSVDSEEAIKLINANSVDSEEAIKLINQYAVDSEEAIKLVIATAFDSDEIINIIEENSIDSDAALKLILANSVDSENVNNMIEEQSIDSEKALILINANSIDSDEALKLIDANSVDSEQALDAILSSLRFDSDVIALIAANYDSDRTLGIVNNNALDSEQLKSSLNIKEFITTSTVGRIDSDSDRQTTIQKFIRNTNEKVGNETARNSFAKSIQPSFKIATQEHIVNDSESSYTVFTFTVPSKYALPSDSEEVKLYVNGVKLAQHNSYNKAGTANVNHAVDVSDLTLLTSPNRIQVTFTNNLSQLDLLTIEYLTVLA